MSLKLIFRVILFIIILSISIIFYYTYLFENKQESRQILKKDRLSEIKDNEGISNELKNIEYNSYDSEGNAYYLNAEKALVEDIEGQQNKVKLEKVVSIINLKKTGIINIYSDYAIYDKLSNNTLFFNNVKIDYLDNSINSQNLDLVFTEKFSRIYNDVVYKNNKIILNTDIIFIDMISGDIKMEMTQKEEKVKLVTTYEFIN